ncbi:MerR family DNA-binding transcriptional regulator [Bosea sp. (in: a-proteobacteria)]|uniref:MerR family DNA-binding transcriptional regulator n=1 Tax=Bosea sp. (in: a-proteobacteria) TaxID=1871050 RepID=UPI0025C04DCC|nr:MerR family DNA-binding transcriptional regulator [Bosea sp. (in: a-proteobacteria)]
MATAVNRGDRHLDPDATRHPDTDHEDVVEGFTIGELARDHSVTLRALRFYESRGLLAPTRFGATRIYRPARRRVSR